MESMPYLCACVKHGLTLSHTNCLKMCDLQNAVEMHLVSTDLKKLTFSCHKHFSTFNFHNILSCLYMEFLLLFFLTVYLHMLAVMSPGWKLDPPERYGTLKGHFDGCLLHAILSVQCRIPRGRCNTAKISLYCTQRTRKSAGRRRKEQMDINNRSALQWFYHRYGCS